MSTTDATQDPANTPEEAASKKSGSAPLLDKIILRGLIPIALAIVGPWATLTFSEAQLEQKKQGETIEALQNLLKDAEKRDGEWRERMDRLEEEKAAELLAMTNMVNRLDATLKTAMIQLAVSRFVSEVERTPRRVSPREVGEEVATQMQLPGLSELEVKRIAEAQFERIQQRR